MNKNITKKAERKAQANIKTKANETNKKASISTQTRLENLQRLENIYKEIEYISKQGELTAAFKDDTKSKALFATFTDIAHNFKGIQNSGGASPMNTRFEQLLELFDLQNRLVSNLEELKAIVNSALNKNACGEIAWDKINEKLAKWRNVGIEFLAENLRDL